MPASDTRKYPIKKFRIGLTGDAGFLFSSVPYDVEMASDLGFQIGVMARYFLGTKWEIGFGAGFSKQKLGRVIDAGGAMTELEPIEVTQDIASLALRGQVSYRLSPQKGIRDFEYSLYEMVWFLDVGGDFMIPISGTQTTTAGTEVSFSPQDKPLFLFLGFSAHTLLSPTLNSITSLQGFYNVFASGGSTAMGARLLLSVALGV